MRINAAPVEVLVGADNETLAIAAELPLESTLSGILISGRISRPFTFSAPIFSGFSFPSVFEIGRAHV